MPVPIPFSRPFIVGKELYYVAQAVLNGHLAGDGPFTKKCSKWLEEQFGAHKVLLTHSGSAALDMAAILCDLGPGDEVIMPSFTFVSTANAVVLRGARPMFVDIRPDDLNMDETQIEDAINDRTRAIFPVHYAGVGCEMRALMSIAEHHGLMVVEDAAQGVNATYEQRFLGTIGDLGCWSFHETKNFICGEGGAIVINREKFVERAEVVREKGSDRSKFWRGEIDKYTWQDVGSSFLPSELTAAFLYSQLEAADAITKKRFAIFDYYMNALEPLEQGNHLRRPIVPSHCRHNAHMFYILLRDEESRNALMQYLKRKGIGSVFHYIPLHTSPMGRRLGCCRGSLPVTEDCSRRLLRLPCYFELTRSEQDRVIEEVYRFFKRHG